MGSSADVEGSLVKFKTNCDDLKPGQAERLRDLGEKILKEGGSAEVHGYASADGNAEFNMNLSCARASRAARDLADLGISEVKIFSHGPVVDANKDSRRSVVIRSSIQPTGPAPKPEIVERTLRVVAKSHIAPIAAQIGWLPPHPADYCRMPPLLCLPGSSNDRLTAFALATDLEVSEEPESDIRDPSGSNGKYRLFSAATFRLRLKHGKVIDLNHKSFETDAGWEGPVKAPPLRIVERLQSNGLDSFRWTVSGTPSAPARALMQGVYPPRLKEYIWHTIEGRLGLEGSVSIEVSHSKFPSVTVFVDGGKRYLYRQGDASLLWIGGDLWI